MNLNLFWKQLGEIISKTFIVFDSGKCGEFIISLLTSMKYPDRLEQLRVENTGSCHLNRRNETEIVCRDREKLKPLLNELELNSDFVKAHINLSDCDILLDHYPNSKIISLVEDPPNGYQGFTNWVTKAIIGEWEAYGSEGYNLWTGENIQSPDDITKEGIDKLYSLFHKPSDYYLNAQSKMIRYPGRYFTIPIDVLYNDRQGTITMLEYISGCTINNSSIDFYNKYMEKQPNKETFLQWWEELK